VTVPHPFLISVLVLALAVPIVLWLSSRASDALRHHDSALDHLDFERVARSIAPIDAGADALAQIEILAQTEVALIRDMLDTRLSGECVSPEQAAALLRVHRQGLAVRQRCGDRGLEAELCWLQAYGSFALMADLAELDRAAFDRDLDHRAAELRRALALRRTHIHAVQTQAGNDATG
jgi:hypothetical protein